MTKRDRVPWWSPLPWWIRVLVLVCISCNVLWFWHPFRHHPPVPTQTPTWTQTLDSRDIDTLSIYVRPSNDTIILPGFPKPLDVARVREIVREELRKHDSIVILQLGEARAYAQSCRESRLSVQMLYDNMPIRGVWVPVVGDHFKNGPVDTIYEWRRK